MELKNIEYNDKKRIEPKETSEEYKKKGQEFADKKDYDAAIEYYDKAISLDNSDSETYNFRGIAYADKKEYDNAINDFTKAIDINLNYAKPYYNRGLIYCYKKDYDMGMKDLTKAIDINPDSSNAYNNIGIIHQIKKNHDEAMKYYNTAIDLNPANARAYNNRGNLYKDLGYFDNAIKDCTKALDIENNYISAYNNRAKAYKAIGELDKSKKDEIMAKTLKEFNDYVQSMEFDEKTQKNIWDLFLSVSELKKSILNTSPKQVGHYTKLSTLKFLIKPNKLNDKKEDNTDKTKNKKPCLRLNNVSYMNDPSEGVVFLELLKQVDDKAAKLVDDLYATGNVGSRQKLTGKNTFLVSLSNNIDTSLPMWTQYTDDGQGACVVFNPEFFDYKDDSAIIMKCENFESSSIQDNEDFKECYCLYDVQYMNWNDDEKKYELNDKLQQSINAIRDKLIALNINEYKNSEKEKLKATIQNLLDQVRFLFKDDIYAYEAEERIIKSESNQKVNFTDDNENFVVPHTYIEMDRPLIIDEVILGPKVKNPTEAANYIYFSDKNIVVSKSRIKYQ